MGKLSEESFVEEIKMLYAYINRPQFNYAVVKTMIEQLHLSIDVIWGNIENSAIKDETHFS